MTPEIVLLTLMNDADILVRSWVARNPQCPKKILEFMAKKDSEKSLREFAKYRISMIESKDSDAR